MNTKLHPQSPYWRKYECTRCGASTGEPCVEMFQNVWPHRTVALDLCHAERSNVGRLTSSIHMNVADVTFMLATISR